LPDVVEVVAALIQDDQGRYLITRRRGGSHLAGMWEFPGGKRDRGESLEEAVRRELAEELGIQARVGERLAVVPWTYPEKRVVLHFFECRIGAQAVTPREGQPVRWVTPEGLARLPFPPADAALLEQLRRGGRRRTP
jgi:8-oxo-dGTP diphosphatase